MGFLTLQHTPGSERGPEMSHDREGGIKGCGGREQLPYLKPSECASKPEMYVISKRASQYGCFKTSTKKPSGQKKGWEESYQLLHEK